MSSLPVSQGGEITPPASVSNAPSAADPTTAGAVISSHQPNQLTSTQSKFSSLQDFKNKAPKVYKAMMQSIAYDICNAMQKHQDRLKALMRSGGEKR